MTISQPPPSGMRKRKWTCADRLSHVQLDLHTYAKQRGLGWNVRPAAARFRRASLSFARGV